MSAPAGRSMQPGFTPPWAGHTTSDLRASDSDRAEVADRLSEHYSAGRLDKAEFDERLGRAMQAKTRSELDGLLADLPGAGPSGAPGTSWSGPGPSRPPDTGWAGPPPARRPYRHRPRLGLLLLVIVIAVIAGHAFIVGFFPLLVIGLIALFWMRHLARRRPG
jgi:Domain of unknown function (DUF1707)